MYTFTTQQLSGHAGMNSKVKIGNWFEDQEYKEKHYQEFIRKKEMGQLTHQVVRKKLDLHTKETVLSAPVNGKVAFGSRVVLFNHLTRGFLSVDLDTKLSYSIRMFGVTTAFAKGSCQRNTFLVERVKDERHSKSFNSLFIKKGEEELLHYGQPFILKCIPEFYSDEDLMLFSRKKAFGRSSPLTLGQEVTVREEYGYESVWKCIYRDPKFRLEFEGETVEAHHPIILVHCATGVHLSSHKKNFTNDFGHEFEVAAEIYKNIHKVEKDCSVWEFGMNKMSEESENENFQ